VESSGELSVKAIQHPYPAASERSLSASCPDW